MKLGDINLAYKYIHFNLYHISAKVIAGITTHGKVSDIQYLKDWTAIY